MASALAEGTVTGGLKRINDLLTILNDEVVNHCRELISGTQMKLPGAYSMRAKRDGGCGRGEQ